MVQAVGQMCGAQLLDLTRAARARGVCVSLGGGSVTAQCHRRAWWRLPPRVQGAGAAASNRLGLSPIADDRVFRRSHALGMRCVRRSIGAGRWYPDIDRAPSPARPSRLTDRVVEAGQYGICADHAPIGAREAEQSKLAACDARYRQRRQGNWPRAQRQNTSRPRSDG